MMNKDEEKRCPLCAEEMDWTDKQFTPCKCGYQICVWCWNHIIDMAEKDQTEGRCPACRTIYEKEKIVAMQENCERTMTKISTRKTKPPKAKTKANEVKIDLTNVRVMQRKMAYVIGLPLRLADEDILVRKEYFGQYGKVTKVSLSRTAGGAIQQFVNDTCSAYITYSKEEEALRCIQLVHGFVLEGNYLRASFGTAKYCHAWLKNMPCNNHDCLYLHYLGADEDSFGKDEVAAVHTRSRVQQIVGSTHGVVKRSGNVLPSPIDSIRNSSSTADKPTIRSGISDATHSSANIPLSSKEKEGANAAAHKMTTFVDVVGRPNSAAPEKDRYISEDRKISNLSSDFSSVKIDGDNQPGEPYSFPTMTGTGNSLFENNPGNRSFLSNRDNRDYFGNPAYPTTTSENSSDPALSHKMTHNGNSFTVDRDPVNSPPENDTPIPIKCVNSVLTDSCQEMKFQNSAKSDRIYRASNSFSNEEIVEHLRRIDGGGDLNNGKENHVVDDVESCIISNIMSIGLDSFEDSLAMPKGLSEFFDETDGLGGSSWSSINSDQSLNSLGKQEGFLNQMAGNDKEQYLCKPQYPVHRSQSLAPPPGFSTSGRTGLGSSHGSSFPNTYLQPSSTRVNGSSMDDNNVNLFDPSLLNCSQTSHASSNQQVTPFDWLLMQQQSAASTHQDPRFSQMFSATQNEASYMNHMGNNQHDSQSFFTQMLHQTYGNGHMPNVNCEVGQMEHQRNERLGVDYLPGYGSSMFNPSDVYTRVFGL